MTYSIERADGIAADYITLNTATQNIEIDTEPLPASVSYDGDDPYLGFFFHTTLNDAAATVSTTSWFWVYFNHICELTTINSNTVINDMVTSVKRVPNEVQTFPEFSDSKSVAYSGASPSPLCGAMTYTIETPASYPYLTLSGTTLTASPNDNSHHTPSPEVVTVTVGLASYPEIATITSQFNINIKKCKIVDITIVDPLVDWEYTMFDES